MNIDEILKKNMVESNHINLDKAIKEIVEGVLQMAADEAEVIDSWNTGFSGNAASVDKQSILNVKDKITF